jgi:hypothetical protein
MMRSTLIALLLLCGGNAPAQAKTELSSLFAPYQAMLQAHLVSSSTPEHGLVTGFDYAAALNNANLPPWLEQQRDALAKFDPNGFDNKAEAVAFWINAYNFFMLAHILEAAQADALVEGVKDFGSFFNPYRVFRQPLFNVGGKRYSLDEMEKSILLGDDYRQRGWWDTRVHFAVNCASVGCPPLRPEIYQAERLDEQLNDNTRRSLANPRHLDSRDNTLMLSRLFDWYEQDFIDQSGSVAAFLRQHVSSERMPSLNNDPRIAYIDYDWRLNRPEHFPELSNKQPGG